MTHSFGRQRRVRTRSASPRLPVEALECRRLLSAGDLDVSFGRDGKVTTDLPGPQFEQAWAVAVQGDDKVVVAGQVQRPGDLYGDMLVVRYNPDGTLDSTFGGGDGWVTVDFEGRDDLARDVALAPGGKIIVAGYSAATVVPPSSTGQSPRPTGLDFAVARLNADGSPDTTFDRDGRRRMDFESFDDQVNDVVVRPDGGVYLAGDSSRRITIIALLPDGQSDVAFDGNGLVTGTLSNAATGAIAGDLDADGRLVIAANQIESAAAPRDFYLARYLPNGQLDGTFGGGTLGPVAGTVRVSPGLAPQVLDVTTAPGGKILAGGAFGVARFNGDGSADPSFSGDGIAPGGTNYGVVVQADGSVLGAGYTIPAVGVGDPILVRFLADGTPDPSFNGSPGQPAGTVRNGQGFVPDVALTTDGRSVTAGYTRANALTGPDLVVTRRLANGALDPSFGAGGADGDGVVVTDLTGPGTDSVADVATLPGGKVLAVGTHVTGNSSDVALARYNADGSLDTTFGAAGTGVVYADNQGRADVGASLVVQADGKILAASFNRVPPGKFPLSPEVIVWRFGADGRPDTTFGTGGRAVINFVDGTRLDSRTPDAPGAALALQPDGRILVATSIGTGSVVVVRLTPAGALDTTFSIDGGAVTTAQGTAVDIAVAPAGKILVLGNRVADTGWTVGRLNPDGTRDNNFGVSSTSAGSAAALAVGPGAEFVVAGTMGLMASAPPPAAPPPPRNFFLARYDVNGRPDPGFGTSRNGTVVTDLGGDDALGDMTLLPDNSIVVSGMTRPENVFDTRLAGDFAVARYTPAGALDMTFGGGDGVVTVDFNGAGDAAAAIAIDDEGRIVAAGRAYDPGRSTDFALARLEGDGPLAPNVAELSAGGSAFSPSFRAYLDALGVGGAGGYSLLNTAGSIGNPTVYVTQAGVNQVTARLGGPGADASVGADDLRVRGVSVPEYAVRAFAYDPATRLATWTLDRPIANDRVTIDMNVDGDAAFELLWRVNVLSGDADGNGIAVNATDLADVRRRLGKTATLPPASTTSSYSATADVTGDGRINALDLAAVKQRLGSRLPASVPAAAGSAGEEDVPSVTAEFFAS